MKIPEHVLKRLNYKMINKFITILVVSSSFNIVSAKSYNKYKYQQYLLEAQAQLSQQSILLDRLRTQYDLKGNISPIYEDKLRDLELQNKILELNNNNLMQEMILEGMI